MRRRVTRSLMCSWLSSWKEKIKAKTRQKWVTNCFVASVMRTKRR